MKVNEIIEQLELDSQVFCNLLSNVSKEELRWKPMPGKWSLLEIVNHLYDEEREDFKARLDKILNKDTNWNPIDPEGWVHSRNYSEQDYQKVFDDFINERKKSIEWLKNLKVEDWNVKVLHPKFEIEFTAFQMLASWLAHDYLHIRQITGLKYQLLDETIKPKNLEYAGKW